MKIPNRKWIESNSVPIVMDDVRCDEDDEDITDCSGKLVSHNCGHSEDIWLICREQGK